MQQDAYLAPMLYIELRLCNYVSTPPWSCSCIALLAQVATAMAVMDSGVTLCACTGRARRGALGKQLNAKTGGWEEAGIGAWLQCSPAPGRQKLSASKWLPFLRTQT
eukprot:2619055-Pleurochrysis_carterae.AAC.3